MNAPTIVAVLAVAFSASLLLDRRASLWTIAAMVAGGLLLAVELRLLKQKHWGWDLLLTGAFTLIASGLGLVYEERRGPRVIAAILIALFGLYFVDQRYHLIG
jgi:uncharacterized membrane protein (UPF0136 family)